MKHVSNWSEQSESKEKPSFTKTDEFLREKKFDFWTNATHFLTFWGYIWPYRCQHQKSKCQPFAKNLWHFLPKRGWVVKGCLKLFYKRLFSYFSSFKTYCSSLSRPMRYSFKGQKNLFRTFGLNQLASIHSWWMVNKISRVKRSQNIKKAAMNTILLLLWQGDFLVKMWCSFKIVVWYCHIC